MLENKKIFSIAIFFKVPFHNYASTSILIGNAYLTATFSPSNSPGFIIGSNFIILTASSCNAG
jgi:hypothetical protein